MPPGVRQLPHYLQFISMFIRVNRQLLPNRETPGIRQNDDTFIQANHAALGASRCFHWASLPEDKYSLVRFPHKVKPKRIAQVSPATTNARSAAASRALVADGKGKRSRVCFRLALASLLRRDRSTQNRSAHRLRFRTPTPDRSRFNRLKFGRENVFQADFQLHQNGFQFVQSQVMLAMLNAEECLIGYAHFLGELCVRKAAPFLAKEFRQLPIQVALHT